MTHSVWLNHGSFSYMWTALGQDNALAQNSKEMSSAVKAVDTGSGVYATFFDYTAAVGKYVLIAIVGVNGGKNNLSIIPTNIIISGWLQVEAGGSGDTIPIFSREGDEIGQTGIVRIDTDSRKLLIYNAAGDLLYTSTQTIPTSGWQEFCVSFDAKSVKNDVWINVFFGDTEEAAFAAGDDYAQFWGDGDDLSTENLQWGGDVSTPLDAGWYGRYLLCQRGAGFYNKRDSVFEAPYPRYLAVGGMTDLKQDADGFYAEWDGSFADVDEAPHHDGDLTYMDGISDFFGPIIRHTLKCSNANPVPSGATVQQVQHERVARELTEAKNSGIAFYRLGGVDLDTTIQANGATTHKGVLGRDVPRPGGGDWVKGDFDANALEQGLRTNPVAPFEIDTSERVTYFPGPVVVYYTDTLPLGTPPPRGLPWSRHHRLLPILTR